MKFGVPWNVKGIRPEARETAREAARRSGMSLGDWLNTVILQQAAASGLTAHDDDDEDSYGEELVGVHQRLDDLSRRIEHFSRTGPTAYAPKRSHSDSQQIAELISRLDRRLDQFVSMGRLAPVGPMAPNQPPSSYAPPTLDRALAEIAARQRALNGQPAAPQQHPAMPSPSLVPVPTQDLSGLEEQLRRITDQIETLRRPGVEEAINALRSELAEIGRTLNDAMPRQAIDAIEKQITGLTQRIAEGRQNGVAGGALANIEHGLAEVRDALRALTPAESLVGFDEAVRGLAHKIDLIVAQKDPATLGQLEHAITTLREMASHVASNEAVNGLAGQVHMLAERVEQIGGGSGSGDALTNLEHRIEALSRALAERAQGGASVPPRLEALVQSLSDKIEQIQQSRGDNVAIGHLEDRIVSLVERLDASDSRLSHLEAIERGLSDLLVHIQDIQSGRQNGVLRAEDPGIDALKHDLSRTQNALEAVNGTLGHVVDRLATIEKGLQSGQRATATPALAPDEEEPLELTEPMAKLAVRAVEQQQPPRLPPAAPLQVPPPAPPPPPMAASTPPAASAPRRLAPANLGPIDPNLPPDEPIEPGSGPPRLRAGARIASSATALNGARPAETEGGKSSFIAAARRAAKAAMQEASARMSPATAADAPFEGADRPSLRGKMMKRVKSVFIAASIIAIVIGAVQIVGNMVGDGPRQPATKASNVLQDNAKTPGAPERSAVAGKPQNTPQLPDNLAPPMIGQAPPAAPSLLSPPALNLTPPKPAKNDITGSIPPASSAPRQPIAVMPAASDKLPIAIGGVRLRTAAAHGDAGAAYEVATRFAEGRGVPVSFEEAARWYERAAGKGLALAQFRYATLLEKGQGVKKDLGHARRLYLAAANQGNAKAMHNLAVLYAEGIEGRPDYATAAQWFRKAAGRGVADSQYNLGVLCARGLGIEKSLTESYKWFALAGAQGDKESVRKRDEVAGQLKPSELAAAQQAAKAFVAEAQPHAATAIPVPPAGWDDSEAPVSGKARTTGRPLSLGAYAGGKR